SGALPGVALSPDGSRISVGGPTVGLAVANTSDFLFNQFNVAHVGCLLWRDNELFVCANDAADGFALGVSRDESRTISPLLRLAGLVPAQCDGSSPVDRACPAAWVGVALTIGADAGPSSGGKPDGDFAPIAQSDAPGGCQSAAGRPRSGLHWTVVA